ncbi:MAG: hypothetical protein ACI8X5_004068 [Planctomycetota bacterium]|jgi:hypothetical protein
MKQVPSPTILISLIAVCAGCFGAWVWFVSTPSMASTELSNADFEHGVKPWRFYLNESAGKYSVDGGIGGSSCLTLAVSEDMQSDGFSQFLEGVSGSTVEFCGQVRAAGQSIQATLYIEYDVESSSSFISWFFMPSGQTITAASAPAATNSEWQELTVRIPVPKSIDQVRIFGMAGGTSGRAWFDNFEVRVIDLIDQAR